MKITAIDVLELEAPRRRVGVHGPPASVTSSKAASSTWSSRTSRARAASPAAGASGALCIAATLQLGAAVSGFLIFEHMVLANLLRDILVPPLPEPVGGTIEVPQRPGLGFELDESRAGRFLRRG